ncbi:MAG: alginate export family protein [Elusimicrobiota bacterium]|nr:alginate export family protein [Elusimicrobiota bacterium]MDH5661721.1 alginate export family protein [Elusimicrobiota bacterium]
MKRTIILVFLVTFILYISPRVGLSGVRVGEEVRIRMVPVSNGDESYVYQRTRLLMEGVLAEGITIGIKLQSRGFWGVDTSTVTIEGLTRRNMLPWIENAYLKADELFGLPLYLALGRQPLLYGDGLLVDDNASGYDAIKLSAILPLQVDCELMMLKPTESNGVSPDNWKENNAYGLFVKRRWKKITPQVSGFWQRDRTIGVDKNFLGFHVSGELGKEVDYRGGIILQSGKGGGRDYKGLAYILGGNFQADTRFGKGIVACGYLVGSGEIAPITGKDENFFSDYAHLSEEEYGEYYVENRSVVRKGDTDYAITNLKMFKLGLFVFPLPELKTGLNYYIYNSYSPKGSIGDEVDISVKYYYSANLSFRLVYGRFMAGKLAEDSANKVLGEVMVKF